MTRPHQPQRPSVKSGFAAITSILVILVVLVLIGISTSYLGIGNAQMSLGQSRGEHTLQLVESCVEDALLYYNNSGTIPSSRTTPQGSCTLTVNSSDATNVNFTTTATLNPNSHSIQVSATRVSNVTVVNWTQIN